MKTKALFISHPHIDHIGGLANLFFCIEKLIGFNRFLINNNTLQVFFPDMHLLEAVKTVCSFKNTFQMQAQPLLDGILFEDENIKVTAAHNFHLGKPKHPDCWRSFSFLIETQGKRIVFSGDVARPEDLDALNVEGADVLIMETGHHKPTDVYEYALRKRIKNLRFNHHGRIILGDRAAAEQMAEQYSAEGNISAKICYDGMVESF